AESNVATVLLSQTGPEGNYRMAGVGAGASDSLGGALDGVGDGVSGGNYSFDFFLLLGDTKYDRQVNFQDLVLLAQNYGSSGRSFTQGDFNYDGTVNFNDLVTLAQHYGQTLPPAAASVVPEDARAAAVLTPVAATKSSSASLALPVIAPALLDRPTIGSQKEPQKKTRERADLLPVQISKPKVKKATFGR